MNHNPFDFASYLGFINRIGDVFCLAGGRNSASLRSRRSHRLYVVVFCAFFFSVSAFAQPADAEAPQQEQAQAADDDAGALADLQMGTFRVGSASPQGKRLGVGLQVGYATAVNAKLMLRPEHAVDVAVGAFNGLALTEAALSAHADYLWHPFTIATAPAFQLPFHVGAGGGVALLPVPGKKTTIPSANYYRGPTQLWTYARVPVGVDLVLKDVPVDVFVEAAPMLLLFPGLGVGCDVSIGARAWW